MKNDELENLMRSLKPAPLPDDLKARLSAEPLRQKQKANHGRWQFAGAAAAMLAIGLFVFFIMTQRDSSKNEQDPPLITLSPSEESPVSVLKTDSTLLNSRTLAIKEIEGQLWEISEEQWRDDTLALCSAGPVKLNSTVIRREIVCSPLEFQ